MEQRFAAAFGFLAMGISFGSLLKEMDVVRLQRAGRAIQIGTGLTSGFWAIALSLSNEQHDFAGVPIGLSFLAAVGFACLFAGVVLITDKLGVLKEPDV